MGKGDKKTRKGKIAIGSYGNTRKRVVSKAKFKATDAQKTDGSGADASAKPKKTARKKSEA